MGYAPVNLDAAAAFLRSHLGPGVEKLSALGHGEWSRAYAFDRAGRAYIVRFSALDEDFRKDCIASRFAAPHLPIPAVLEIGEALGGSYAISERATGTFLDALDAAAMRALLPSLFAAFDAMRQADLASTTGYGIWGGEGHAPHATWPDALLDVAHDRPGDRIHGWRERLATSPTGAGPD
jgi:hygromycin-B 4-O-kinase